MLKPIAVKALAALNQAGGGCPRCFWLRHRHGLPYQIFPGIFTSIDGFTKRVIEVSHAATGRLPAWLTAATGAVVPVPVPHYSRFRRLDPVTGLVLRGAPDGLYRRHTGGHAIADYKTAARTAGQDALAGLYAAQLNGYAWIADGLGYRPVECLSLIYTEPTTVVAPADLRDRLRPAGLALPFTVSAVPVAHVADHLIPALLARAKAILDGPLPTSATGCGDCDRLAILVDQCANRPAGAGSL